MGCEVETETVTLTVQYRVDVERTGISGVTPFGPVRCYDDAKQLLLTLAARSDVTKATLVKETVS